MVGIKLILRTVLCFIIIGVFGCAAQRNEKLGSARQVFLVRHAERFSDGADPGLTREGETRAQALAATLRDAGITAIITTQWRRTRDTATPLAAILRITPEVVPIQDSRPLEHFQNVAAAVRRHQNETVLVIGHVTVTNVIAAMDGPRLPTICENVFSDLLVFAPAEGDRGLQHLHYGAAEDISPSCRLTAPLRENRE